MASSYFGGKVTETRAQAAAPLRRAKLLAFTAPFRSFLYLLNHQTQIAVACSVTLVLLCGYLVLEANSFVYEYSYHGRVIGVAKSEEAVKQAIRQLDGAVIEQSDEVRIAPLAVPEVAVAGGSGEAVAQADAAQGAAAASGDIAATMNPPMSDGSASADALTTEGAATDTATSEGLSAESTALSAETPLEVVIDGDSDIEIKGVKQEVFSMTAVDTPEDIVKNLASQQDIEVKAWQISINGVPLGTVASEAEANALLADVQAQLETLFLGDGAYKTIGFEENVVVSETRTALDSLDGPVALSRKVMSGTRLLHLQTTVDAEYDAEIPFTTIYKPNDALYEDETKTITPGTPGVKHVIGEIVYRDGVELTRNEFETTVLIDPVPATAERGTRPAPERIGTGSYVLPITTDVTSLFGPRWGRTHEGIDFGADVGTSVVAADTGVVTAVGYESGYGLVVRVDHGAGMSTLYGHLSEALVEVGDKVEQGAEIAKSGNTGFSTGPHLHFALLQYDTFIDPRPYLPALTYAPYYRPESNTGG
ncbi:MAG: peptidoglycan DD-metalloendopeptidase family protein [Clostridiales Family XIII bacterium]|nr:peptidoglycan DD-metalloendopeptidase family protein [Clostridiales Family XIII bacterium]